MDTIHPSRSYSFGNRCTLSRTYPYRGKRNEPSYIVEVAQKLADIHESPLEAIAEKTTENAVKLFNL